MWIRAAVGGNKARLMLAALLPHVSSAAQRAPELCAAWRVWCRWLCQPFITTEALVEDRLPPRAPWFLVVLHGAHLVPLCQSVVCFFLCLAALSGWAQSLAKLTHTKNELKSTKQNIWCEVS